MAYLSKIKSLYMNVSNIDFKFLRQVFDLLIHDDHQYNPLVDVQIKNYIFGSNYYNRETQSCAFLMVLFNLKINRECVHIT